MYILPTAIVYTMTTINVRLDKALHKALKIKAIGDGISMEGAAIKGIEWYLGANREKVEEDEEGAK